MVGCLINSKGAVKVAAASWSAPVLWRFRVDRGQKRRSTAALHDAVAGDWPLDGVPATVAGADAAVDAVAGEADADEAEEPAAVGLRL